MMTTTMMGASKVVGVDCSDVRRVRPESPYRHD